MNECVIDSIEKKKINRTVIIYNKHTRVLYY